MTTANAVARYNAVARALHWIIAILIIVNLALGLAHESLPKAWNVMTWHKSFGLSVLILTVIRILWRFTYKMPPWPATMPQSQVVIAKLTHLALYFLMLAMPITGWIFSSAGKYPIALFGIPWPKLAVTKDMAITGISHEGHEILGFIAIALIVLHIAAAIYHHRVVKDDILKRMM
ncbi:cytochrome b [Novosphingobium sp. ZN18A2]|uniref:cytochrome b n=1 Tax=Novosphingobium sp. ZN18A2 TaxID=3079861 RepID=UPI0030CB58F8